MSEINGCFAREISKSFNADSSESVFEALFREYEHVIFRSIITSFGLDVFIRDQHGGDVDTIHGVRSIGIDPLMDYKSVKNKKAYEERGKYEHKDVEKPGNNFISIKRNARKFYDENPRNNTVQDAYEDRPLGFFRHSKERPIEKNAELDHVISAKSIHEDRGRMLAGLGTAELADSVDNLKWTNEHLNKSMGADEIPDYIEKHPELANDVKSRMMDAYAQAKASYEKTLIKSYYYDFSNPNCRQFYQQAASSALHRGFQMGVRQAVGFLVTDIWFSIKDCIEECDGSFVGICHAIANGLKKGVSDAMSNYQSLIEVLGEGLISGILSSITSTVANTFITTSANIEKIVREGWAAIVEAASIILFNDKEQYLCDRMTSAAKVLATGASVIIGTTVQEAVSIRLSEINLGSVLIDVISEFAGSLCTGLLSVSFLFYIDNGPFTAFLTKIYEDGEPNLKKQGDLFKQYCAELENVDIEKMNSQSDYVFALSVQLDSTSNQQEINRLLRQAAIDLELPSVFDNHTIDECMQDPNWILIF